MQTSNQALNVQVEDLSQIKKKVSITVPAEDVKKEIKSAYASLKTKASVAGFRKGAAPVNVLKKRFAAQVEEDVMTKLIERSYPNALRERHIMPAAPPKFDVKSGKLSEEGVFSYDVTVEVMPKVEISDYLGMELERLPVEVKDDEVEDALKRLADNHSHFNEVDRPAKDTDMLTCDFEGTLDGTPIKNSATKDYPIMLGATTLLPGFNEALAGAVKGQTRDAKITFPADYTEANLAGKTADFRINVKSVKEKITPGLDDEFAKDLGVEGISVLRARVGEEIKKAKDDSEKERLKNRILDKLIEKHKFEVPDGMVSRYLSVIVDKKVADMKKGHFEPADKGLTQEQVMQRYHAMAFRHAQEDIVLDALAAQEKVEISKEEIDATVRRLAAQR
ncbi:MAG: trigger factor, partial [Deltaproteobacteria bacterium]|nr:trigger factor [Deltaproteobacteria bacterium]